VKMKILLGNHLRGKNLPIAIIFLEEVMKLKEAGQESCGNYDPGNKKKNRSAR
jgi:hypothetical protein